MPDAATLPFALTYAGTLAVAALIFFGQFAALTILLALAGIVRLVTLPVHALTRREDMCPAAKDATQTHPVWVYARSRVTQNSLYGRRGLRVLIKRESPSRGAFNGWDR
jgi:hypothetical protein